MRIICLLLALLVSGCASYQSKVDEPRRLMQEGKHAEAAEKLRPLAEKQNDDQLVYLFDYGTALQQAGKYKESNEVLIKADKLSDVQDYTSLSREAGSILLNEGLVQYKGDDYEKVMVNAEIAMNYLMMGNTEEALVEARRLNQKLYKYKFEAKKNYEQNPFAFYLSALMWEAEKNVDSAYIDYNNTYKVNPDIPYLREDLIRAAKNAQRPEELAKWKKQFPEVKMDPRWKDKNYGEVVLIYQQGWGPRKFPNPEFTSLPKLYPTSNFTKKAKLVVDIGKKPIEEETQKILSVQDVAIKTLNDQYAGLIAKRVAGMAAKAVVADQIRQKQGILGDLAYIGMTLADRADLRQWSMLPESFQVAKLFLPAGEYKIKVVGLTGENAPTGEEMDFGTVKVQPRKKTFLAWRSFK